MDMPGFVAWMRRETICYRVSAQRIDDIQRKSNVEFENLEAAATTRVFQIDRPSTALDRAKQREQRAAQRAKAYAVMKRPHTARTQMAAAPPPKMWITHAGHPDHHGAKDSDLDEFGASSHHFKIDVFNPPRQKTPKTARIPKTPLIVKRHLPPDAKLAEADGDFTMSMRDRAPQQTARR
jgi:hypothetical protein